MCPYCDQFISRAKLRPSVLTLHSELKLDQLNLLQQVQHKLAETQAIWVDSVGTTALLNLLLSKRCVLWARCARLRTTEFNKQLVLHFLSDRDC